jgi:hypothetical protein
MEWSIEVTDEFREWFANLGRAEKIAIARKVDILEEVGPVLGRPDVDTVKGSRFPNMEELRVQYGGQPYRILFAFDPRQTGILLIGGRKGPKSWYTKTIALADSIYARYLEELKKEGLL